MGPPRGAGIAGEQLGQEIRRLGAAFPAVAEVAGHQVRHPAAFQPRKAFAGVGIRVGVAGVIGGGGPGGSRRPSS